MRHLYSLILYCLVPFVLLRLLLLGFRSPMYWSRWSERLGLLPHLEIIRPVLWLHAVSVGEVEASTPLVERLLTRFPQYQIIITTVTPTGAQTVQQRFSKKVIHLYLPYDLPYSIQRFLRQLRPVMFVVMETEVWPNLYHYCHLQNVPVILVNARMSSRSFCGYKKILGLMKKTFDCVDQVIAQTQLDADRIISLGCDPARVSISGNLKFDISIASDLNRRAQSTRGELFSNRPVWIAASTHEGEEELVLDAYERILTEFNNCMLIIAPRHPQRFDKVADLCFKRGFNVVRKSSNVKPEEVTQIFLLDTLGELLLYYGCADFAFVGGSLVAAGGHNMLEPASMGVPIISGMHVFNFHEISNLLREVNAIFLVKDTSELAEKATLLLTDAKLHQQMAAYGKRLVTDNRGGTDQVMSTLQSFLE